MNTTRIFLLINILLLCNLIPVDIAALPIELRGFSNQPVIIEAQKSTGIDNIIVLKEISEGSELLYESSGTNEIEWLEYSNLGAGFASRVENLERIGNTYRLTNPQGNRGYLIRDTGITYVFWLVDYSVYPLALRSLETTDDNACEATVVHFEGSANPIYYYTVNGRQETLSRELHLSYKTLVWDSAQKVYNSIDITQEYASIGSQINIFPPVYSGTDFVLSGDRFLREWHEEVAIQSNYFHPKAVEVNTSMDIISHEEESSDNVIDGNGVDGGYSAPLTARFQSYVSDAVAHFEWQMSSDPDFNDLLYRFYEQDLEYTFEDQGTYYIRFIGSNSDGSCESTGETYSVNIGTSQLLIPNAFSPNGDGINDVWKVAYKSLIKFKCWIFDRHGHQIYYYEDPSGGWDGKNGSKFVNPGVYFYVIEAQGSDGVSYKKKGDINILKSSSSESKNPTINP